MEFVYRVLSTAVGLAVAAFLVPGINLTHNAVWVQALTLIGVAIVFGVVNALLKPLIKVVGCVLYVLTLGLIGLVVNGLLFWLAAWISGKFGLPFEVTGFLPGFFGAIVVAVVGFVLAIPLHIRAMGKRVTRH
ncbi:MAG TPA: phage holin family protein [Pseudonocardiaceae bacterium]|nr:phage holin family protein [Pseudonocardiaceae bacterium]